MGEQKHNLYVIAGCNGAGKTTASRSNKLKTMVIILILSFSLFLLLLKTTKNQLIYPFYQPQVCAGSVWAF